VWTGHIHLCVQGMCACLPALGHSDSPLSLAVPRDSLTSPTPALYHHTPYTIPVLRPYPAGGVPGHGHERGRGRAHHKRPRPSFHAFGRRLFSSPSPTASGSSRRSPPRPLCTASDLVADGKGRVRTRSDAPFLFGCCMSETVTLAIVTASDFITVFC